MAPLVSSERSRRPSITHHASIDDNSLSELVKLVTWIQSDGRLRTDDEMLEEAIEALGFERRGSRIEATLRKGKEAWRKIQGDIEGRAA